MSAQKMPVAGLAYATEVSTTALPIAVGAGTLTAVGNIWTLTFAAAHGYTQTIGQDGRITIQNVTTGHGPTLYGQTYFQLTGATVVTAFNAVTWTMLSIPTTTTMTFFSTLTGAPVVTAASLQPVFALNTGFYNVVTGANAVMQYNPDGNGLPQGPLINPSVTGATFRALIAVSSSDAAWFDGVGQSFILCSGAAGTTRWSFIS